MIIIQSTVWGELHIVCMQIVINPYINKPWHKLHKLSEYKKMKCFSVYSSVWLLCIVFLSDEFSVRCSKLLSAKSLNFASGTILEHVCCLMPYCNIVCCICPTSLRFGLCRDERFSSSTILNSADMPSHPL